MKAHQIFQAISPALGGSIFQYLRDEEKDAYKGILLSLAQEKRLRPVFVQRKPVPQQIQWMLDTCKLKLADTVAEHLLQIWLLKAQKELLIEFLDELGIEHDEDGTVEDLPQKLDAKKLKGAVDKLLKTHSADAVAIYLHMFQLQQTGGWPELADLLQSDERLILGAKPKTEPAPAAADDSAVEEEA